MRVSEFLVLAIAGFLACSDAFAVTSNDKHQQVLLTSQALRNRDLADDNTVYANEKRVLRTRQTSDDEDEDEKLKTEDSDSDDEEEERGLISTLDYPKYWRWFRAHMTPYDVKEVLGLTGLRPLVKPIKRRVYKGYVRFYEKHCRLPKYRRMAFCRAA
ncbi:hypothetical protein PRIC1_005481 [Phytophthora ramorum]